MPKAHDSTRTRRSLLRARTPLTLGLTAALAAVAGSAAAQVGSANVPLPNVMLLLDSSGSFEHMIDGSNPEDTGVGPYNTNTYGNNNTTTNQYANCETAWYAPGGPYSALPNKWGVAVQALTGHFLNSQGSPFYSCVTMDRATGPLPTNAAGAPISFPAGTFLQGNGLDVQYGIRDEGGNFFLPYDSGYYLPFHRPVDITAGGGRCVYSPWRLPGATSGGVGLANGATGANDCLNEPGGTCQAVDFPTDAINTFLYDRVPALPGVAGSPLPGTNLLTPNVGYSANNEPCVFNQASDGIIEQASTLVRFGLMTFDNDPSAATGVTNSAPFNPMQLTTVAPSPPGTPTPSIWPFGLGPLSPFTGQWSYDSQWDSTCAAASLPPPLGFFNPSKALPVGCTTGAAPFQVGARNPGAPPWEGRLMGFPSAYADVNAAGQGNMQIATAVNAMRPYGATPTAGLMVGAEYYFWGDPTGPGPRNPVPDPYVQGGCRSQYIILLTDGAPNLDMRPSCQGPGAVGTPAGGLCPYQLPEDTASVLATGATDLQTGLGQNEKVYTYVIGFAVSGNVNGTEAGSANCAQLAATNQLATICGTGTPYSSTDTSTTTITPLLQQQTAPPGAQLQSPCCSLQRIAVAGGTQHAYFADTPGDLQAALAAVIGDITGQLGSRTIPVASPTISYSGSGPLTATFISTFSAATCPAGQSTGTGQCLVPWQSNGPWTGDIERQQYQCPNGGGTAQPLNPGAAPAKPDDFGMDLQGQNSSGIRNFLFFSGVNSSTGTSMNALTMRPYLNTVHGIVNNANTPALADNLDTFASNGQIGTEVSNFGQGGSPTSIYSGLTSVALGITSTSCQDPASAGYLDPTSCANLALSFAMAQSTFPLGTALTPLSQTADQYLQAAYQTGQDGPVIAGLPTNRATYPFATGSGGPGAPLGAILDSTPAIIAVPSAQVRDDSYQSFSTALSPNVLAPPRDTMLYVATVDGLLHAFDTTAGLTGSAVLANQVESWAFVPPAVLPNLISNYPGASNILLDGTPVVKDVIFSRCSNAGAVCGSPPSAQWVQNWHTMLVAGFGLGGRGYYALDVTDPRPPSPAVVPNYTSTNFPTFVASGTPPSLTGTGPHFQWQITDINLSGTQEAQSLGPAFTPTHLFGKISGTPAIATVYADPTLPSGVGATTFPQEIGVAILPGGHDGLPTQGLVCTRELAGPAATSYSTTSPLWTTTPTGATLPSASPFNVSDTRFPPRVNVRGWAQNCVGSNSAVAGRSVMVVSVATGQVLAVFARKPSALGAPSFMSSHDPTAWDVPSDGQGSPLIASQYIIPTPLDSPMTGRPVVYPSGVGVVAQAVYIGDADGTMWRFDLSDPNPRNWTGAIFADAYSPAADPSNPSAAGTAPSYSPSTTDWTALDSEAISVEPQLALDTSANLVMNFATGDQTAFNACYSVKGTVGSDSTTNTTCTGSLHPTVNLIYSVKEAKGGTTPYHAVVNWYDVWTTGERVTGPMAIFNGNLYFATYVPPGGTSTGCGGGGANLYAWDFSSPATPGCGATGDTGALIGCGGSGLVDPNFAPTGQLNYVTLQAQNPGIMVNTIIPGVSIASTPSCATTSTVPSDAYTGGVHTAIQNPSPPTYSLMANIGKGKNSATQNLVKQTLKAPTAPTIVDSWAAVSE